MPTGVIINSSAVFIGGLIGALCGSKISKKLKTELTLIFGVSSMAMGVSALVKINTLPAVILAVIMGVVIGEIIHIERGIENGARIIEAPISKIFKKQPTGLSPEAFMEQFISVVVLFCASGTGIFGALQSGMTGDHTMLISKSILDFFTAVIFAANLGYIVAVVSIPQFFILLALYFSSSLILPHTTEIMIADFTACGGLLMLATGFRIAAIKAFPIANMLPAMALVMPFSYVWNTWIVPML